MKYLVTLTQTNTVQRIIEADNCAEAESLMSDIGDNYQLEVDHESVNIIAKEALGGDLIHFEEVFLNKED